MKTINNELVRSFKPCYDPSRYVRDENEDLPVLEAVNKYRGIVPDEDIIWLLCREEFMSNRDLRLFAIWCAREALRLVDNPDPRSIEACNVAERYANGEATDEDLRGAYAAADAAYTTADAAYTTAFAAYTTAYAAAFAAYTTDAAYAAVRAAACAAARAAARADARADARAADYAAVRADRAAARAADYAAVRADRAAARAADYAAVRADRAADRAVAAQLDKLLTYFS